MTTTEIAVRQPGGTIATERDVVDGWITVAKDVSKLADYIAETEFVPKALRNKPAAIAACILTGRELGIGPMASLKSIHMVQGVPSLSAEYKRARALAAGHQIVIDESNSTRCVVRGRRAGSETWLTITWTMDHARRAKLAAKDVWLQYPQRMLQARATSELCDLLFPDATLGLPTTEELEDGGMATAAAIAIEAAAEDATEAPKPATGRTARRATAKPPADRPAAAPSAAGSEGVTPDHPAPAPATAARNDPDQPPLPGEDEPDPTPAGSSSAGQDRQPQETSPSSPSSPSSSAPGDDRHRKLAGAVQGHMKRLGFTVDDADRAERLPILAKLAGISYDSEAVTSTSDFDLDELSVIADTLAKCRNRAALDLLLDAGESDD